MAENRALRDEARIIERTGNTYTSRLPSLRVDCTYLITAWSVQAGGLKTQEEHHLLGLALIWVSRIPRDRRPLPAGRAEDARPALPAGHDRGADPGRAADGASSGARSAYRPRPAFSLTVTITVEPFAQIEQLSAFQQIDIRTTSLRYPALSGRVLDHTLAPVPAAAVTVVETGEQQTSGADGGFAFAGLPFGAYTLKRPDDRSDRPSRSP